ncbi:MAG: DUF2784 domain-containing protein [Gemmatimonadetes bacterium]|nr:DUF2784 domain-containing protein [Gemmatimonadota bacterium]
MGYRLLADLMVIIHFAFIVFVLFGGLLALRWRRAPWLHLPSAAWGGAIELFGWICPLTPLENALRRASGAAGYSGGFIEHYLIPIIYPRGLTRGIQLVLGCLLIAFNIGVYFVVWRRWKRSEAEAT